MSVLKPCLLCEGEAKLLRRSGRAGIACPSKWYRERVECKVCGLTTREYKRPGSAFRSWNNRPRPTTTPCDELETVAWRFRHSEQEKWYYGDGPQNWWEKQQLVTRQNAEEVIAAERMKLEATARVGLQLSEKIEELEADNASLIHDLNRIKDHDTEMVNDSAAKDVRIAELEAKLETANALVTCCCGSLVNDHDMGSGHSPVDQYHYAMVQLESDNKRLREALENLVERFSYYADLARDGVPNIEDWAYTEGSSDIAKARAVLGEVKP